MPAVHLADRNVISIAGADAREFLQGLVTCDMAKVAPGAPAFGALLTPQGKILFDFLIVEDGARFLLDAPREKAADLVKRLGFYKLRAKVEISDLSDALAVAALFGDEAPGPADAIVYADPRDENLGRRAVGRRETIAQIARDDATLYEAHRISCGVPKGGVDFAYGDAFPHETNMDLLHGIAFDKGCYVGQEVVSRMQHRGLARKRIARVSVDGEAAAGAEIRTVDTSVGVLGGVVGGSGLATVRLDRLDDVAGLQLMAGSARVSVER